MERWCANAVYITVARPTPSAAQLSSTRAADCTTRLQHSQHDVTQWNNEPWQSVTVWGQERKGRRMKDCRATLRLLLLLRVLTVWLTSLVSRHARVWISSSQATLALRLNNVINNKITLTPLQRVQSTAARLVLGLDRLSYITSALRNRRLHGDGGDGDNGNTAVAGTNVAVIQREWRRSQR